MPSVRALALEAEVNPNTMQKALAELETQGLLHTQRTSGRTVTSDEKLIIRLRTSAAQKLVEHYFAGMRALGFERKEALRILSQDGGASVPTSVSASVPPSNSLSASTPTPTSAPAFAREPSIEATSVQLPVNEDKEAVE
jgi:DNA-binding transcriptional MocR family regulator